MDKRKLLFVIIIPFLSIPLNTGNFGHDFNTVFLDSIDIDLPSNSTGMPNGTLAVRIYAPLHSRYQDGAPIIIYVPGADTPGGLRNCLPPCDDIVAIYFIFPGGIDDETARSSDGVYDHRGLNCIMALRDVILYAAGKLTDSMGRKIDDVVPVPVLHNNIGLAGMSNGGNIVVAVAALYGDELAGYLRYIIQWESPVSSQIATVDLGPIKHCSPNNFVNPRYISYGKLILEVDYSDLTYNANESIYSIFHDGNGDGRYTTVINPETMLPTPDLNLNGKLELDEDFPLNSYVYEDGVKKVYSRPVTHALMENNVFSSWPSDIATPAEADAYWDIREAVRLYDDAVANIPDLRGMVLASVKDHVQSAPDKPHIRQAFDGWNDSNAWVKINPSPFYVVEVDPSLAGRSDLPDNKPNIPPNSWNVYDYCMPEDIPDGTYQLAAVLEMADRVYYNRWYSLIINLHGGFGITLDIKNVGKEDADNIRWMIDVRGAVIMGQHTEGIISIPAGSSINVRVPVFGFGVARVEAAAGEETKAADCFIIGPIVFLFPNS